MGNPPGPTRSSLRGRFLTRTVPGAGAVPFHQGDRPMSALSLAAAQKQFTATLSAVEDAVHYAFHKRLRPQEYREALAEARAAAWHAWHGLSGGARTRWRSASTGSPTTPSDTSRTAGSWGAGPPGGAPWTCSTPG